LQTESRDRWEHRKQITFTNNPYLYSNLMAPDEMKNLGFANPVTTKAEVHESIVEREEDTRKLKEEVKAGR
jgi:hypothetical protein